MSYHFLEIIVHKNVGAIISIRVVINKIVPSIQCIRCNHRTVMVTFKTIPLPFHPPRLHSNPLLPCSSMVTINSMTCSSVFLLGFEVAENDLQCVYSHFSSKTNTFASARAFCESIGGVLAQIQDSIEIQDILPDSILHTRIMQQLLAFYRFKYVNDTRYYWIERTDEVSNVTTTSQRLLSKCSVRPDTIDVNCLLIQYVKPTGQTQVNHQRCIIESNDCSTKRAMPVCVDRHIDKQSIDKQSIVMDDDVTQISVDVTLDHRCNDTNNEYHLIDGYCYRIYFHEVGWNDARAECQKDQAVLFVPEKSITLQHIKTLFLLQQSYTSSGLAHVGVFYNPTNRTVLQYNISNDQSFLIVPDSNAIYDLCEKTFQERYIAVMSSTNSLARDKDQWKQQQIGCGYIDLGLGTLPTIRCDEIPCHRTATVICQKPPISARGTFEAVRYVKNEREDHRMIHVSISSV
jgi:hypothetical protein